MEISRKRRNVDLELGAAYAINVVLPDGRKLVGTANCGESIILQGDNRLAGVTSLDIDDLTHFDEHGDIVEHDYAVEMIQFAVNDGSVVADMHDYGFGFELPTVH